MHSESRRRQIYSQRLGVPGLFHTISTCSHIDPFIWSQPCQSFIILIGFCWLSAPFQRRYIHSLADHPGLFCLARTVWESEPQVNTASAESIFHSHNKPSYKGLVEQPFLRLCLFALFSVCFLESPVFLDAERYEDSQNSLVSFRETPASQLPGCTSWLALGTNQTGNMTILHISENHSWSLL